MHNHSSNAVSRYRTWPWCEYSQRLPFPFWGWTKTLLREFRGWTPSYTCNSCSCFGVKTHNKMVLTLIHTQKDLFKNGAPKETIVVRCIIIFFLIIWMGYYWGKSSIFRQSQIKLLVISYIYIAILPNKMVGLFTSLKQNSFTSSSSLNPKIRFVKNPYFKMGQTPPLLWVTSIFLLLKSASLMVFSSIFWSRKPGRPSSGWPGVLQVKQRRSSRNDGIQWFHQRKIGFRLMNPTSVC